MDKDQLKADCIQGSIVNGFRETILFSIALFSPSGHKVFKKPRINFFKKINKLFFYHITVFILKMIIINQLILMEERQVLLVNYLKYNLRFQIHSIIGHGYIQIYENFY